MVSAAGAIKADPNPCNARATFRERSDQARPAKREEKVNTVKPATNILRAPKISDNLPPNNRNPPKAIT